MEENGKSLEADMKKEVLEENKYYEEVKLELSKIRLNNVMIEEKHKKEQDENDNVKDTVEYGVYIKFKGENVKIATINEAGNLIPNKEILNNEDKKYTDEELNALGDMLNRLGLEDKEVDINKLQEQLKTLEAKTKEEIAKNKNKNKEDESIKDDNEEEKEEEEENEKEDEKELAETEKEGEVKAIAKRLHVADKNVCKIRRDSQFYKNYPNIPKTAFFYLDENHNMHAEYIDKDGTIKELSGFNEIKDRSTNVTRIGNDGENIKEERPYRVMTAQGLEDKNHNTQAVRIAIYKDTYGYLRIETIHQGRNGEWEGKNIDTYGRDRNTRTIDKLIDERHKMPETGLIAKRHDELIKSGYSQDGLRLDELSKRRKIEEYVNEGYTKEEANSIYEYVIGELQLREEEAKVKVNEEKAETIEEAENDGGRTPGGDAWNRRHS